MVHIVPTIQAVVDVHGGQQTDKHKTLMIHEDKERHAWHKRVAHTYSIAIEGARELKATMEHINIIDQRNHKMMYWVLVHMLKEHALMDEVHRQRPAYVGEDRNLLLFTSLTTIEDIFLDNLTKLDNDSINFRDFNLTQHNLCTRVKATFYGQQCQVE